MEVKTVAEINQYTGSSVNPLEYPEQIFELYSVPSFETGYPEIIKGKEIGSTKITVKEGDVLVCKINPRINRVWVVRHNTEHPLLASSEWIVVRNSELDSNYLKWYFTSPTFRALLNSQVAGIGGSLTRAQPKQVAKYPIPIPSVAEQENISKILDKVDKLMSLRREQLAKLDQLVKARFVELFGECEEHKRLGEYASLITKGASPKWQGVDYCEDGTLFVTSENVREGYLDLSKRKYLDDKINEIQPRSILKRNDILINIVGASIGRAAVYDCDEIANINQAVALVRVDYSQINQTYLMTFLNSPQAIEMYGKMKKGGARDNLSLQNIADLQIPVAPMELQNQFADFVEQTDKSKLTIQQSLDKLEVMKNAMMQEYFG